MLSRFGFQDSLSQAWSWRVGLTARSFASSYSVIELRETVHGALAASTAGKITDSAEPVSTQLAAESGAMVKSGPGADAIARKPDSVNKKNETPRCPECSAPMVRREAKRGANTGHLFWGCSVFPKCRGMLSIG